MTHAWCRDVARDEAVRAAEDGRSGPLPTLEQAIEGMFPKSGSASSAVEPESKGDGMRTERVTLEVTHGNPWRINTWEWAYILRLGTGESVRVVEEELSDAWAQRLARLTAERDAAIRSRDDLRKSWLRSEESGTRLLAERNAALDAADGLRKRVSELEAASGGGEGEPVAWGVMSIADPPHRVWLSWDQELAERWARQKQCDYNSQLVVVPLYRQPPQPRGWLTGEEKAAIRWAMSEGFDEDVFRNLLSRSSPPEVVLPVADCSWCSDYATVWRECLEAVRSSLAAAGVAVKEVGRE